MNQMDKLLVMEAIAFSVGYLQSMGHEECSAVTFLERALKIVKDDLMEEMA